MADENADAKDLTTGEMLKALLADMRDAKERLARIEDRAEERLTATRPLLHQIIREMVTTRDTLTERMDAMSVRLDNVERDLRSIDHRLETFSIDYTKMRTDIRDF